MHTYGTFGPFVLVNLAPVRPLTSLRKASLRALGTTESGSFRVRARTVAEDTSSLAFDRIRCCITYSQVAKAVLEDPQDTTELSLIYANKTEGDILVRDLLDEAAASSNGRFKVHYTLDFPPEGWTGGKGFVSADMITAQLPRPQGTETLVMMCGPPPMVSAAQKNLAALGYPKEAHVAF